RRSGGRSGQRRPLHLVGAVAESAAAQHRLASRLRLRERAARRTRDVVPRAERSRHQRSCTGGGDVRVAYKAERQEGRNSGQKGGKAESKVERPSASPCCLPAFLPSCPPRCPSSFRNTAARASPTSRS